MEDALRMMELAGELAQEVFSLVFGIRTYLDANRLFLQVKEAQKKVPKAGEGLKGSREIGEEANQGPDTGSSSGRAAAPLWLSTLANTRMSCPPSAERTAAMSAAERVKDCITAVTP